MSPWLQRTLTWVCTGGYVVPIAIIVCEWIKVRSYNRKARSA